jgi:hypothetical protein
MIASERIANVPLLIISNGSSSLLVLPFNFTHSHLLVIEQIQARICGIFPVREACPENSATLEDRYWLGSSKNQESSIPRIDQSRRGG